MSEFVCEGGVGLGDKQKYVALSHPRSKVAKHCLSGDEELTVMKNRCSSKETKGGQIMETSCLLMICLCSYHRRM